SSALSFESLGIALSFVIGYLGGYELPEGLVMGRFPHLCLEPHTPRGSTPIAWARGFRQGIGKAATRWAPLGTAVRVRAFAPHRRTVRSGDAYSPYRVLAFSVVILRALFSSRSVRSRIWRWASMTEARSPWQ